MSSYKHIITLLIVCFIYAWIFGDYPIKQFAVVTFLCLVYFFMRAKHANQYSDKREDETIKEYQRRKAEEEYQHSIAVTQGYISNRIFPLIRRYGIKNVLDVINNLGTKTLWTGAHKEEVLEIMGKPYEVQYKRYTEDWCYQPSKNALRFGQRIKFKGDRVYDFRL